MQFLPARRRGVSSLKFGPQPEHFLLYCFVCPAVATDSVPLNFYCEEVFYLLHCPQNNNSLWSGWFCHSLRKLADSSLFPVISVVCSLNIAILGNFAVYLRVFWTLLFVMLLPAKLFLFWAHYFSLLSWRHIRDSDLAFCNGDTLVWIFSAFGCVACSVTMFIWTSN